MPRNINQKYRQAADEFAGRVITALGNQIDSIILYGSVARGEARRDSDIDILIVSPDPNGVRKRISEICEELMYQQRYTLFISTIHFNRDELDWHTGVRSLLMRNVFQEGVILYDNGTFCRKREEATPAGR